MSSVWRPGWAQSSSRHRGGVIACIFTAYIPDGSYSYMTNSASEFLLSLTFPRAPAAQVVHSQVEVRPADVPEDRWDGGS